MRAILMSVAFAFVAALCFWAAYGCTRIHAASIGMEALLGALMAGFFGYTGFMLLIVIPRVYLEEKIGAGN